MKKYHFVNIKNKESFVVCAKNWAQAEILANKTLGGLLGKMEASILKTRFYYIYKAEMV